MRAIEPDWQFWIDVGGTFTDCLARRPDGRLGRYKLLSSGTIPGTIGNGSTVHSVVDHSRRGDPEDIWRGFQFHCLNTDGSVSDCVTVARFESSTGTFHFERPLSGDVRPGNSYELKSDEDAPLIAVRYLLGLPRDQSLPRVSIKLGTTKGTNALLTRTGAACAFVTTRGFADVLRIGYQNRRKLFDLAIEKPEPLFVETAEIDERVSADGSVLRAPERGQVEQVLRGIYNRGIRSLAICLLHAYRFADHERFVELVAREIGFDEISCSSEVAPFIKIVSRGDTTVVDAYLNPVLRSYVARLNRSLNPSGETETSSQSSSGDEDARSTDLRFLTSAGGLVQAQDFRGKDSILSGPAGGVVGFSRVALAAGFSRAIGFDMGGTSTDVSRFDERYDHEYETEKAGVRIVAPMMAIETVAAGGGSICWFDGVKLCVGPDSAGANPGPACYGRGGPLTVTDVNFFLGKIPAEHFPFRLQREPVERHLRAIQEQVERATAKQPSLIEIADGFLQVANAKMAKAIRSISIAKGYDPREYLLVPFGGAAGQHACAIATELGMNQLLYHPDAGILSAYGIGLADVTRHRAEGLYLRYGAASLAEASAAFLRLEADVRKMVLDEGIPNSQIQIERSLDIRFIGTDAPLTIPEPSSGDYAAAFLSQHRQMYGYVHTGRDLEIVAVRVEARGRSAESIERSERVAKLNTRQSDRTCTNIFDGAECETQLFDRGKLRPGDQLVGPAIILESTSTAVIDPGWQGEVLSGGEVLVTRTDTASGPTVESSSSESTARSTESLSADPVLLEVFNNHFAAIAEQMGITLRSTSSSVNVKERLDFSCALFTAAGDLVVNAPHIPVHLGAMSETVKRITSDNREIRAGDAFVTNDPYRGGSHLPDITVVTPVFDTAGEQLMFFTASRAHHAEIGGVSPGSMPPFSRSLAEEGVLLRNFKLVDAGESRMNKFRELLSSGRYPSRNVNDNLYDVSAQIAANQQGTRDLLKLVERYGWPLVEAYMSHIQTAAEQKMRAALAKLPAGPRHFTDYLDDGSPISVTISVENGNAVIDFTGTGPVSSGNLNANRAIVSAAVMYCLRCLIGEDIPLNQGVLAPVRIVLPECLLNPPDRDSPERCAAVAGGNVETSQRVVDVLLGALDLAAASQGTMNNFLFGDATFGYYETICGGSGATRDSNGADAVHTHMTNTRLTDPEVLEHRYPVRLREFTVRAGSGGAGRLKGGDGVVRRVEFLREVEVSLLTQRRGPYPPYGKEGGSPGQLGRNSIVRASGTVEDLPAICRLTAKPGDVLSIETPGGGGWGRADE